MTDETEQVHDEASPETNPRNDVGKLVRISAALKSAFSEFLFHNIFFTVYF